MLKNPFSFYDFLGYLFPGLICVIFLKVIFSMDVPITIDTLLKKGIVTSFSWKDTVQYTVLAYVVGHLVSYFSSLTIEPYLIWSYGYPSVFLLKENYNKKFFDINTNVGEKRTYFWKILVCVLIFPICLASLLFGNLLRLKFYVLKPLDPYLRNSINNKVNWLLKKLSLSPKKEGYDVHRILMHYNYEHYENHIRKYDNYIALYGFLRSLSLLCSSIFVFLLRMELRTIDIQDNVDWTAILILVILFCVTYLYYLGFVKFYRRYTLENLMSIVVDEHLTKEIAKSVKQQSKKRTIGINR